MNHFSRIATNVVDQYLMEQEELKDFLLSELKTGATLEDICYINEIDLAKAKRSLASAGVGLAMLAAMGAPVGMAVRSSTAKETPAAAAQSSMVMKRFNHQKKQADKRQAIDNRRESRAFMADYNKKHPPVYASGTQAAEEPQSDGKQTIKLSRGK